jgi:hypothetical protein
MSSTAIQCRNESDITVEFQVQWGVIFVGKTTAAPDQTRPIGCEFVWYDVYVTRSSDGAPLARKIGVYGNSTVVLEKQGNIYHLI